MISPSSSGSTGEPGVLPSQVEDLVEVVAGYQIMSRAPAGQVAPRRVRGRRRLLDRASSDLARRVTVPSSRPSPSTTTPRPDGEDSAASSAARSEPPRRGDGAAAVQQLRLAGRAGRAVRGVDPAERPAVAVDDEHPAVAGLAGVASAVAPSATVGSVRSGRSPAARKPSAPVAAVAADEAGDEVVGRVRRAARPGSASWASLPPTAQHGDLVAELDRLVDVVGDEHDGLAELGLQPEELVLQLVRGRPGRPR